MHRLHKLAPHFCVDFLCGQDIIEIEKVLPSNGQLPYLNQSEEIDCTVGEL